MKIASLLIYLFHICIHPQESPEMIEIEFIGTYQTGRAPCEWLPDGSRRWAITTGFTIDHLTKGDFEGDYVEINIYDRKNNEVPLEEGKVYTVNIILSKKRLKALQLNNKQTIMSYQNPILEKEIKNIVKKIE